MDSDFVRVRVLGLPPAASELQFIDFSRVQEARQRQVETLPDEPLIAEITDDAATRTLKPATESGTVLGTAAYMSPEQAECKPVDARSDIFSFGAVLYEMATGRRAFAGDSQAAIMAAVLHKEPNPPREASP
jgi:serine/threonine protein kinase